jgi:hypothetical protein
MIKTSCSKRSDMVFKAARMHQLVYVSQLLSGSDVIIDKVCS